MNTNTRHAAGPLILLWLCLSACMSASGHEAGSEHEKAGGDAGGGQSGDFGGEGGAGQTDVGGGGQENFGGVSGQGGASAGRGGGTTNMGGNTTPSGTGGTSQGAAGGAGSPVFDVVKHLLATAAGGKSEAPPAGVPANWSWVVGATQPNLSPPSPAHTHANYWGAVFRGVSNRTPANTHVEIRHCQTWILYRGANQWTRLDNEPALGGATFSPTYAGGGPAPTLVRQPMGADVVPAVGHIWHYWPSNSYQPIRGNDVSEILATCQTRLGLRDQKGTDDRDDADYINHVGIDWRDPSDPSCSATNYICPSVGVSLFFKVTKSWRNNTFHSLSKADLDTGVPLPPAEIFASSDAPPPQSPGSPLRIVIIGDSLTEQAASWIHPFQQNLIGAGCPNFELIGYSRGPYNGTYVAPTGLSPLRIAAGGFSSRGIRNWIDANQRDFGGTPDLLIQYLGVNNVYGGFIDGKYNPDVRSDAAGAYIADSKEILGWARLKNARVAAFLMKIQDNLLPQIAGAIDQVVNDSSTASSPVRAVVSASGVSRGADVHPDVAGAARLAGPVSEAVIAHMKNAGHCR